MKTREQAEARARELYPDPKHDTHWERERVKFLRQGFFQCFDEMQQEHEKQSLAIEKEPVSAMLVNVMRYCDQNQRVQLIKELQERTEIQQDKQDESKCCSELIEYKDAYECPKCDNIIPKSQGKQTCGFCVERKEEKE